MFEGVVEQPRPAVLVFGCHGTPFTEPASRGRERVGVAVGDELVDDRFGEFDEQVTGSSIVGGEEGTVDPQTRQGPSSSIA